MRGNSHVQFWRRADGGDSVRLASDLDEDGLVAQAEMDGLLKELARSLVDEEAGATAAVAGESAEELLAQAHADDLADTELIVEAVPDEDEVSDHSLPDRAMEGVTGQEPVMDTARTMMLFDYMAAQPQSAPTRKGKKACMGQPSAQLLLFDLFAEQPEPADAANVPAAPAQQQGLFAETEEREEVA